MAHVPRIHWPEGLSAGQALTIEGERAHHLLRVLKRKAGDELILFGAPDCEHAARIVACERNSVSVLVGQAHAVRRESPLASLLVQGVSRGERMDYSIQKCVELGIGAIQPVLSRRSGVQLDQSRLARKQEHWQGVALSAAEQSGRTAVPEVRPCLPLEQFLAGAHRGYVLAPDGRPLADAPAGGGPLELLVGPEGGLDETEVQLAQRAGLQPLALGPRILRTETAGLVALAALQLRWGDLGTL